MLQFGFLGAPFPFRPSASNPSEPTWKKRSNTCPLAKKKDMVILWDFMVINLVILWDFMGFYGDWGLSMLQCYNVFVPSSCFLGFWDRGGYPTKMVIYFTLFSPGKNGDVLENSITILSMEVSWVMGVGPTDIIHPSNEKGCSLRNFHQPVGCTQFFGHHQWHQSMTTSWIIGGTGKPPMTSWIIFSDTTNDINLWPLHE